VLAHGVHLPVGRWVLLVALLWVGAAPLALLGLVLGYFGTPQTAQVLGMAISLGLAILGGLLFPVNQLPPFLRHVARVLPTYQYAELGWRVVAGHAPTAAGVVILAAWMVGFALLAALGFRRNDRAA
jgi:ABC-2 type transport system permease protein